MTYPYVLSRAQMQAVDAEIVARTGLPTLILMENAGRGVAQAILRRTWRSKKGGALRVAICCGSGNNGGDGTTAARHLALAGAKVKVLLAALPAKMAGDAAIMLRALSDLSAVAIEDLSATANPDDWARALSDADVIVDALFGTGLGREASGAAAAAISAMNACPQTKVAVDIPSGLDADSGRARGAAVRAGLTVTMGARKIGLVINPDANVGKIEVVGLGAPVAPSAALGPFCFWLEESQVQALLPRRAPGAHKGSSGHLVAVAGSAGKTGAALLTARAALRAGAGLVTVMSTAAGQVALDAKVVEPMTASYSDGEDAGPESFQAIASLVSGAHVRALVLGPGIPTGGGMRVVVERTAREIALPMVIDADGLNLLGERAASCLAGAAGARIVTPHPGEMARLVGRATADVQSDRLGVARAFAAASRAVVILKGAHTLVVAPDGGAFINPTVEPALATAGSGDVLTGVIGGLLAQGMDALSAAQAAVVLHGRAGEAAAREHGGSGVIAGDLPDLVATVRASWASLSTDSR